MRAITLAAGVCQRAAASHRLVRGHLCVAALLLAALLPHRDASAGIGNDCIDRTPTRKQVSPGEVVLLAGTGARAGVIIEEFGGEFSVQSGDDDPFVEVAIRPPRLGIVAIPAGTEAIRVRLRQGDAPAELRVHADCSDTDTLAFLAELQKRFDTGIDAGAEAATLALSDIERDLVSERHPWRRAWLLHARANAMLSAGLHARSSDAFTDAREAWLAIGDGARAAVALLAAAEDLSRSGQFDEADRLFEQAESELSASGATYYALRARAARCLIVSRRGRPAESVVCEEAVADAFEQRGDVGEAVTRGISIANQWMKLGGDDATQAPRKEALAKARARLLRVDAIVATLSPVARAKLHAAFGTLHLQTGDLHAAAQELKAASDAYGALGLPRDQASLDLKLASVAQRAGAFDEELRLLERAVTLIDPAGAPDKLATASLRIAESRIARGELEQARRQIALAAELCSRLEMGDCVERATLIRAEHELAAGRATEARVIALAMPTPALATTVSRHAFVLASADLAIGEFASALRRLESAVGPELLGSDPDLFVLATLVRADAEVALGMKQDARNTLRDGMDAVRAAMLRWPSAALRATGRHRSMLLSAAYFDLIESTDASALAQDVEALRSVLAATDPLGLLAGSAPPSLSPELRDELTAAIIDDRPIDPRELFLGMVSPTVDVGAHISRLASASQPAPEGAAPQDGEILLLPLTGRSRFQLLAVTPRGVQRCIEMPMQEYTALVERFSSSLLGEDQDLRALNRAAETWFDAIIGCGAATTADWRVLTLADAPAIPWNWIAAVAETRDLPEPAVIHSFSVASAVSQPDVELIHATILNLDPGREEGLPLASTELDRVADYFADKGVTTQVRAGISIDADVVLGALRPPGHVVHIIGHGGASDFGALYSGLWLPRPNRPRLLAFPDVASAKLHAELVVLSACGDMRNDASAAGSRLRLVEALLGAGVRHVVAWSGPASDSAAALWSARLYEELHQGRNLAQATRAARRILRRSVHYRHPKYWAGTESFSTAQ